MNDIKFNLEDTENIDFSVDYAVKEVYPPLENLEVTPSVEEQVFNHENSYGYDEVKVKAIEDENLVPENIKQGVNILGVEGTMVGGKYAPRYTYQPISFQNYKGTELDQETSMLDTIHFTTLNNTFKGCSSLTRLDVNHWNTSNVTSLNSTFNGVGAKEINLSNWDTSKVTNANMCFFSCSAEEINLSGWVTTNMTNMSSLFYLCTKLKKLDIRNFTFENVTSSSNIFAFVPNNCLIIVKGQTEKDWVLTQGSNLTNVKTIAEYENGI